MHGGVHESGRGLLPRVGGGGGLEGGQVRVSPPQGAAAGDQHRRRAQEAHLRAARR